MKCRCWPSGSGGPGRGARPPGCSNRLRQSQASTSTHARNDGELDLSNRRATIPQREFAEITPGTRAPSDADRLHVLSLRNGTQICYANSVILAYLWCIRLSAIEWSQALGLAADPILRLLQVHRPTLTSFNSLAFLWYDWPQPHIQHDASEFWAHFLQVTGSIARVGVWEARKLVAAGVQIMSAGSADQAVTIPVPAPNSSGSTSLQVCLTAWRRQLRPQLHAFTVLPSVLCLHLERYTHTGGRVRKTKVRLLLPEVIQVPNSSTMPQWRLSTSLTGSLLASFIWGLRFSTVTMLPLPFALKGSGSWMTIERVSGYLSSRCSSSPTFTCCGQLRSRCPQEDHDLEQPMRT